MLPCTQCEQVCIYPQPIYIHSRTKEVWFTIVSMVVGTALIIQHCRKVLLDIVQYRQTCLFYSITFTVAAMCAHNAYVAANSGLVIRIGLHYGPGDKRTSNNVLYMIALRKKKINKKLYVVRNEQTVNRANHLIMAIACSL